MRAYLGTLKSIPHILYFYPYVNTTVLISMVLKMRSVNPLTLFFFKIALVIVVLLYIYMNFRISMSISLKNKQKTKHHLGFLLRLY